MLTATSMKSQIVGITRAVVRAGRSATSASDVFRAGMTQLVRAVPNDGWCGLTLDPATLMTTGGLHEHGLTPTAIRRLLEIEYGGSDVGALVELARSKSPLAALSEAGGPPDSVRYRDVLVPSGYGEELRVVLRNSACWGAIAMFRKHGGPPFSPLETDVVEAVAPAFADALRAVLMTSAAGVMPRLSGRAVLVFDEHDHIVSATPRASEILVQLAEDGPPDPLGVPHTIQALVHDARRLADESNATSDARTRTRDGGWVTIRASAAGAQVIVVIEPSDSFEVASLILRAYGLTRREGELVRLILHGFDTAQIAEALAISAYTVQDHLKAIFDKVGVDSRKELVARLFFTHYLPRVQNGVAPGPDGWFLDD